MPHQLARPILQRLVKVGKPFATRYITTQYGAIAGQIAGVAISVGIGDYSGAFTGLADYYRGRPPARGNPPFGYFDGGEVVGPPNGPFFETLRSVSYRPNRYGNKRDHKSCKRCRRKCCRPRQRSSSRKYRKSYLR